MRLAAHVLAFLAILLASGCFVAEVKVARDGSGTMDLRYMPAEGATYETERARFSGPGLDVESVQPDAAAGAHLVLRFADVTALSHAPALAKTILQAGQVAGKDSTRIRVVLRPLKRLPAPPDTDKSATVAVTLPGRVLSANGGAKIDGSRVVWQIPVRDYV